MARRLDWILGVVFVLLCAFSQAEETEWGLARPEAVGLDAKMLDKAVERVSSSNASEIHSLLVLRHGKLVLERYFSGSGRRVFDSDRLHEQMSITKTVVALLVGIARDQGKFASLDTRVMDYLPAYADLRSETLDKVSLRHVLSMSLGLSWNEWLPFSDPANTLAAAFRTSDPLRMLLKRPFSDQPGSCFRYNSISTSLLVSALRSVTGIPVEQYAETVLFRPLGIRHRLWERHAGGDVNGGWGLSLRPRDMAKIGQLILDRGVWQSKRIVSSQWIDEMTSAHMKVDHRDYGYLIWCESAQVRGRKVSWVAAMGSGGQKIYVVPELDMVVVMTAGYRDDPAQDTFPNMILTDYVLAAAKPSA